MTILHLSDPHFGTEQPAVVAGVLAWAATRRPRFVILSGDITQRARRSQFEAASAFIDALCAEAGIARAKAFMAVPGNHDIPLFNVFARLVSPYGGYQRVFGDPGDKAATHDGVRIVAANTTRWWRHKDGEVDAVQITDIGQRLEADEAATLRIAVTHQPAHVQREKDRKNLLHGHARAIAAWSAARADLILGGHIHVSFAVPLRDAYPGLPYPTWAVQTGTAVSSRIRQSTPNSFHCIEPTPGSPTTRCLVERWDYDATARAFVCVVTTPVPVVAAVTRS